MTRTETRQTVVAKSWPFAVLRTFITLSVVMVLIQAVLAGQIIDGDESMVRLHGMGGGFVHVLGILQVIAAILVWRPGRGSVWPLVASVVILLAGFVQSATGGSGNVILHVPLGVLIFGLLVWMTAWTWRRPPA